MNDSANVLKRRIYKRLLKIRRITKSQKLIESIDEYEQVVMHKPKTIRIITKKLDVEYTIE